MFGFDWKAGYVSPFRSREGDSYTTPSTAANALIEVLIGTWAEVHGNTQPQLIDLGSGDGRIVLAAARHGVKALGIELDEELVTMARHAAQSEGLIDCCTFEVNSLMDAELPQGADIITYLLPSALGKVAKRLASIGHTGRLFVVRWSVDCDEHMQWHARHDLGDGWIANEYRPRAAIVSKAAPSSPIGPDPSAGRDEAPPEGGQEEEDGGTEWQSLPCDIFEDPNIVPVGCESYELMLGVDRPAVRVRPRRSAFERSHAALGGAVAKAGEGADAARMTGALLWDSAVILTSLLARRVEGLQAAVVEAGATLRCIELGAGLGLVGLGAAALGCSTVLTDRAECIPLLEEGIRENRLEHRATARTLDWGDSEAAEALGTFDLVLAADCLYEAEIAPRLVETMIALISSPQGDRKGEVWVAYDEAIGRPRAVEVFRGCARARSLHWEDVEVGLRTDDEPPGLEIITKNSVRVARLRFHGCDQGI